MLFFYIASNIINIKYCIFANRLHTPAAAISNLKKPNHQNIQVHISHLGDCCSNPLPFVTAVQS